MIGLVQSYIKFKKEVVFMNFWYEIAKIQPSQLFLNESKLAVLRARLLVNEQLQISKLKPIPIKRLNGVLFYTDGHHTAFITAQSGFSHVLGYREEEELDWDLYEICIGWCSKVGITTISDLASRILPNDEYEKQWIGRCRKAQQELQEANRRDQSTN